MRSRLGSMQGPASGVSAELDAEMQSLIDDALVATNSVARAALISRSDNAVVAATRHFKLSKSEHSALCAACATPGVALQTHIKICSRSYRCVRADGISLYGCSGRTGVVVGLTKTLFVVATYSNKMHAAVCAEAVETLASYLKEKGR